MMTSKSELIYVSSDSELDDQEIVVLDQTTDDPASSSSLASDSKITKQNEVDIVVLDVPVWNDLKPRSRTHRCDESCLWDVRDATLHTRPQYEVCSPYMKPLLRGFTRDKASKAYYAPCSKRLANLDDVSKFLKDTLATEQLGLAVDMFTFDWKLCPEQLATGRSQRHLDDMSCGAEPMPIRAVNNVDDELWPTRVESSKNGIAFTYMAERDVIRHDTCDAKNPDDEGCYKDFCSGCDCEVDCMDSDTCACRRLTQTEHERLCEAFQSNSLGYKFRLLYDVSRPVRSGIYECNQWCKCREKPRLCSNRVAQHKINIPLELYKTAEMGWGVRSRVDLPVGLFVCTYEGAVKTNLYANAYGANSMYYADLDLYESLERDKREGLPPDTHEDVEEDNVCVVEQPAFSLRGMFGKSRKSYVVDAERPGNIAGFINHSCDPNLTVQHVFYDTHDIRLPLVAFFTKKFVEAGTPLSWDYKYKIGSEPGKVIYCKCSSGKECRGRLL